MTRTTFRGGYCFKNFIGQPDMREVNAEIPPYVIIPLTQGFGSSLSPLVNVGDTVFAGQIIGRDDTIISSPVHASVHGKVTDIVKKNYFKKEVSMVIIKSDQTDEIRPIEGYSAQWEKLSSEAIEKLLYIAGVTSLDREGIPTHFKTSIIMPEDVEHIIIHGTGSEPYNTVLDVLLKGKKLYNFITGIKIFKKFMPRAHVHCALNKNNRELIEKIKKLTSGLDTFTVNPVSAKYPQGYNEVLVPTILKKDFPYGYSAANIGVVVLTMQSILHAFEAVVEGKPLIERTIALCGPSFKENVHIKVRIGTPLNILFKERMRAGSFRAVLNSPITGATLNDLSLPVDKTFSQIIAMPENSNREFLAFLKPGIRKNSFSRSFASYFLNTKKKCDTNMQGEERPCFQCGYCSEVCPVRILPTFINRYIELGINESLMKYGIFNCIDCNLCSYVCPAKISLAKNIKDAKANLIEMGCDHSMCILPKFDLKGLEEYKGVKSIR